MRRCQCGSARTRRKGKRVAGGNVRQTHREALGGADPYGGESRKIGEAIDVVELKQRVEIGRRSDGRWTMEQSRSLQTIRRDRARVRSDHANNKPLVATFLSCHYYVIPSVSRASVRVTHSAP